jgi:hypothetical protein
MFDQIKIPFNLVVENNVFLSVTSSSPKYLSNTLASCIWLNQITFQPHYRDKSFSKNANLKSVFEDALIEMMIVNSYENSPPEDGFNYLEETDEKTQQYIHIRSGENSVVSIRWYLLCKESFNHIFSNVSKAKSLGIYIIIDRKDIDLFDFNNDDYQAFPIREIDFYLHF